MAVFDPNDWRGPGAWFATSWFRKGDPRQASERNRAAAHRCATVAAFCLCFASLGPPQMLQLTLSGLFAVAALASAALALVTREHPGSPYLTAWDEAALLLLVSAGLGFGFGAPGIG